MWDPRLPQGRGDAGGRAQTRLGTSGQHRHSPLGVLDDPPVVDVLEGVAGHLLLVGAATAVLITARGQRGLGLGAAGAHPGPPLAGSEEDPNSAAWAGVGERQVDVAMRGLNLTGSMRAGMALRWHLWPPRETQALSPNPPDRLALDTTPTPSPKAEASDRHEAEAGHPPYIMG